MRLWHVLSPDAAHCVACGRYADILDGLPLCPECAVRLLRAGQQTEALCPRCLSVIKRGKPCPVCRRDPDRLIARTYAPYRYRGVVRGLILRLKFSGDTQAAALLAPAMAESLPENAADLVVPVPLGPRRLKERSYNQAFLLAMLCADRRGLPVREALIRVRETRRQSALHSIRERGSNLRGAITVRPGESVEGLRVLLVDDVRTSGATALACAKALREHSAAEVSLLCAAIAPGAGRYFERGHTGARIYRRKA